MVQPKRRRRSRMRTLQPTLMFGAILLIVVGIAIGIWLLWRGSQPRFVDVMIELGQPMPKISEFTTKYADPDEVEMLTPESEIHVDKIGVYSIKFRIGKREETEAKAHGKNGNQWCCWSFRGDSAGSDSASWSVHHWKNAATGR